MACSLCSAALAPRASNAQKAKLRLTRVRAVDSSTNTEDYVKKAEALIIEDPKALAAVERVRIAAEKVADVRARQLEVEEAMMAASLGEQQRELLVRNAERDADAQVADAEVVAAQTLLRAAELEAQLVESERLAMLATINQDAERKESGKAAAAAAAGGLIGSVPLALAASDGGALVALGSGLCTCALFGVVYRYIVRDDSSNPHLVGGAVAAFGLTRGLALAEAVLGSSTAPQLETVAAAALAAGQSMLVVSFAAVAIEAALQRGLVARFGHAGEEEGTE